MTLSPPHQTFQHQNLITEFLHFEKYFEIQFSSRLWLCRSVLVQCPVARTLRLFHELFCFCGINEGRGKPKSGEYVDCGIFVICLIHSERAVCNDGLSWRINHTPGFHFCCCFFQMEYHEYYKTSNRVTSFYFSLHIRLFLDSASTLYDLRQRRCWRLYYKSIINK